MKARISISCVIVLSFCLYLLLRRSTGQGTSDLANHSPATNSPEVAQKMGAGDAHNNQPPNVPVASTLTHMPPPRKNVADTNFQQGLLTEWQVPIDFYGKVVDESNNPVGGAGVQFNWSETPADDGEKTATAESDLEGLFVLHDARGASLDIRVGKQGYYTSRRDTWSFSYAISGHFHPDSLNPVVFHLRKKGPGAELITADYPGLGHIAQLKHDGTPIELDLIKNEKVPLGSGNFSIELERELVAKGVRKYNWKLQFSVPNGGLIETDDEFDFQAPQSGYQPSIVIDMPATSSNWHEEVRAKYYILLPNGNYGRIDFYLLAYNGAFTIQSAINPTGSQNLEPAP